MADVPRERAPGGRPRRLSWTGWLVVVLVCAALAGAGLYRFDPLGRAPAAPAAAPPPVAVTAAPAARMAVQDELTFVASLAAPRRITISPYTSGHVTQILKADGAAVAAGEPLFRLDDRTAQAELALAQGKVDVARAKLQRDRTLQREGFLAEVSLSASGADLSEAEVDLRLKQLSLELLTIKAPFAGRLEQHQVAPGQNVTPGTALVDLIDPDHVAADFQVPERQLAQVREGARVSFGSVASPATFTGQVVFVSTVIDPDTRSFAVRAVLDDPEHQLRPGLFGRLRLATGPPREAIVVPEAALIQQLTGAAVYLVADGRAKLVQVETGQRVPAGVELTQGVGVDDQVVTSGQFRLRDGDAVLVQPQTAASS